MILTHPSIDPIIFSISFFDIRWYSLAYILAFIIGLQLIKFFNKKINLKLTNKLIDDFFIWAVIGVIIGGRLGYVLFYQFKIFLTNPIQILYIWEGGMSFHGGLLGIIIATFIFTKLNNINFFLLADLISLVAPIGLFLGRIANFINVELIGRVTEFPLAIIYPTIDNLPRHPSQLYEALFEGIILFIILVIISLKMKSRNNSGVVSAYFLIFYGLFRFLIEFLRQPDQHIGLFFNLFTMGQLLCIPFLFFGLILIFYKKKYV